MRAFRPVPEAFQEGTRVESGLGAGQLQQFGEQAGSLDPGSRQAGRGIQGGGNLRIAQHQGDGLADHRGPSAHLPRHSTAPGRSRGFPQRCLAQGGGETLALQADFLGQAVGQ